jgi:hypothetical protein
MNKYELYMGKLKDVELDYNKKLNEASRNENDLTSLFFELNVLRKYYNKKIKYYSVSRSFQTKKLK